MSKTTKCPGCERDFPAEDMQLRKELLKVVTCKDCTRQSNVVGVLDYDESFHERTEGNGVLRIVEVSGPISRRV